jgi:ATP-dependent RNA helicase RhlE
MQFQDLRLDEPILRAVEAEGYDVPTPIQAQAIPHLLDGKDLLGCAQTGTGKTAAFALPILNRLRQWSRGTARPRPVRALILSPTRELAAQTGESFRVYGRYTGLRCAVIYGGVGQASQTRALSQGVDILVATPGRLLDLMGQRCVDLRSVKILVLDEADRMLDMGFIHDVRRVVEAVPRDRQTLLFSATMPDNIRAFARDLLRDPVTVEVAPVAASSGPIDQSVFMVAKADKPALLKEVLGGTDGARVLVFTRTRHGADRVERQLTLSGFGAAAIHGSKAQGARERALAAFRSRRTPVLVATDIAARGLDVEGITHVVNYDLPSEPETYIHRIGRTGRMGASGVAISFCDADERGHLRQIEGLVRRTIPVRISDAQQVSMQAGRAKPTGRAAPGGAGGRRFSRPGR